jgi:hypothetical protein
LPTRSSRSRGEDISFLKGHIPDFIHIYKTDSNIDWPLLKEYITTTINNISEVNIREPFFSHHLKGEDDIASVAESMVRTKVFDASDPHKSYDPFPIEIEHEKEAISDPSKKVTGVLYDGYKLHRLFRGILPLAELSFAHLHIILTNRLIGTWVAGDGRYHARVCILGFPSIISTTGVVEAPAKPREFYIARRGLVASGMDREVVEEELKTKFEGRFIDYNDERIIDIIKGYIMQAFFYHTTFEPFCTDKNCRLFNAHWQEEMIHAQLEGNDFCERHEGILKKIKEIKK